MICGGTSATWSQEISCGTPGPGSWIVEFGAVQVIRVFMDEFPSLVRAAGSLRLAKIRPDPGAFYNDETADIKLCRIFSNVLVAPRTFEIRGRFSR